MIYIVYYPAANEVGDLTGATFVLASAIEGGKICGMSAGVYRVARVRVLPGEAVIDG